MNCMASCSAHARMGDPMTLQELVEYGPVIGIIVEGTGWQLEEKIEEVVAEGNADLLSRLLVSAAEISARQLAKQLVDKEMYEPLAVAACLRRQPRRPGEGATAGGVSRRIFRDVDAEEGAKGVPDYILSDIEEMSRSADMTRASAMGREAAMDRDPIRQYIVDNLAPKMPTSEAAANAMIAIARSSAWEETRRTAALKVANEPITVARLVRALRTEDIIEVCHMALLTQVAETFAREMGRNFQAFADAKDVKALQFMAEKHPDERFRDTAAQWVTALTAQPK
jgi:hypothetical protein